MVLKSYLTLKYNCSNTKKNVRVPAGSLWKKIHSEADRKQMFFEIGLTKNISLTITSKTYISKFYQQIRRPAVQSQYSEYK